MFVGVAVAVVGAVAAVGVVGLARRWESASFVGSVRSAHLTEKGKNSKGASSPGR